MIAELTNFLATLAISPRRIAGEINGSVRLWARASRCAKDWAEHEARSQAAILEAMDGLPQYRTAVVLGSGLLRDVPIGEISGRFEHVVLVDLQHLASVRFKAWLRGFRNLSFVHRDLSGLDELEEAIRRDPGFLPDPLAFIAEIGDVDLVVSANLLSQIGVGAKKRLAAAPADLAADMTRRLIEAHLDALWRLEAPSCLVTDIAYDIVDRDGRAIDHADLMQGIVIADVSDEWRWPVAPFGEIDRDYRAVHRVISKTG